MLSLSSGKAALCARLVVISFALLLRVTAQAEDPAAQVSESAQAFRITNGLVSVSVDKQTGNLTSIVLGDTDLLSRGKGYWSQVGRVGSMDGAKVARITQNPAENGGQCAEVSVSLTRDGRPGGFPVDVDFRCAVIRGIRGVYVYSVWSHEPGYPPFDLAEARYALKLNPGVFDRLTIDQNRNRLMPSGQDWDRGTPTELKEVRRIVTGQATGTVEHKYDYSAVLSETPAYGWCSTAKNLGIWVINPSMEYMSGGPTKVELTGHLDVNPGGAPTLLNMWVGSHYGGSAFSIAPDEKWRKVVGPFLIYCNQAKDSDALWQDALTRAAAEKNAWPYEWVKHPLYLSPAQRGLITGRIEIPSVPRDQWTKLQVGLTAPNYPGRDRSGFGTVDWQRDAKNYQFWTQADAEGRFALRNVLPGKYTLRAFADGIAGEMAVGEIEVSGGQTRDLGAKTWIPETFGKTLWQIGKIDRTAGEFRNGDHYWQWGLPWKFTEQFPNGVNFVIGKSDPAKDWNYCQVASIDGRRAGPSTWAISFQAFPVSGTATLRLGIAGSRTPRGVEVLLNDRPIGATGPLPDTGVMHRDGIRGYWCERRVTFDASLLQPGENVIKLRMPADSWVHSVLYDYVRLELQADSSSPTPSASKPPQT